MQTEIKTGSINVIIYKPSGNIEESSKGKSGIIDLSAYPGGIYHLTIQTGTSVKTMKLVKN